MIYLQLIFRHLRVIVEVLLILALVALWFWHKYTKPVPPPPSVTLPTNTKERISIDTRKKEVLVVTRKNVTRKTGVRHAQIDIGNDGSVTVRDRHYGFSFEPGFAFGVGHRMWRAGVDAQFYYYRNFGAVIGLSGGIETRPKLKNVHIYPGLIYRVPLATMPNTSFYIGSNAFNFLRDWEGGMRISF